MANADIPLEEFQVPALLDIVALRLRRSLRLQRIHLFPAYQCRENILIATAHLDLKEKAIYVDGKQVERFERKDFEIPVGTIDLQLLMIDQVCIDDLKIYSVPLSDEEILSLYKQ